MSENEGDIEIITDRGRRHGLWAEKPQIVEETRVFASKLNLVPCFTPVANLGSNGISETFVKTFKRDCVRVNPLRDAATVLDQIDGWFGDYNENHPHSGLRMRLHREFIRAHQPAKVSG